MTCKNNTYILYNNKLFVASAIESHICTYIYIYIGFYTISERHEEYTLK